MKKTANEIKKMVREGYGKIAKNQSSCCASSCCKSANLVDKISQSIGYSSDEIQNVPEGANLGLGCGNPVALASLKEGEVVLDLGSGAGFDAFLAAKKVGKNGRVIGVDMTQEMLDKAKLNAQKGGYSNVEFLKGEIEELPVQDNSIDVIISNCVINLSPDKKTVFKEALRVLKPGGRLMVSDLVLVKDLPQKIRESIEAYVGCLAGAVLKQDYLNFIKDAGFKNVKVIAETFYPIQAMDNEATAKVIKNNPIFDPENIKDLETSIASIKVYAEKGLKTA